MNLNLEGFMYSLTVMGKGMAGIFIVTAIIVLAITLLNKISDRK